MQKKLINNNYNKHFSNNKIKKILICLVICLCAIILDLMAVIDEYNLNNFLIFSFFSLLVFAFIYLILFISKKSTPKIYLKIKNQIYKLCNVIKILFKKSYDINLKCFHNRLESDLFYCGLLTFVLMSHPIFELVEFGKNNIIFIVSFILFSIAYKFMLHIIFSSKN